MDDRIIGRVTVEYHEQLEVISIICHVDNSPMTARYQQSKKIPRDEIKNKTYEYWKRVWPIVCEISKIDTKSNTNNSLTNIRAASAFLVKEILEHRTIEILWKAAKQCEILRIETNLIEIPWEALINPHSRERLFLSQMCSVARGYLIEEGYDRPYLSIQEPLIASALYIDAELLQSWDEDNPRKGKELNHLSKLSRHDRIQSFVEVDLLFEDMRKHYLIQWVCENSFDKASSCDRLRISSDVFLTENMLLTEMLPKESVVCLVSCTENVPDRKSDPIAAQIAAQNGCTVISPLLPLEEAMGLAILRFFRGCVARSRRRGSPVVLSDLLRNLRARKRIGHASAIGILLLFIGLYGNPNVELR